MHVIPKITDPLGVHWKQPKPEEILIDDRYTVMTKSTFEKLAVYERSYPTGSYIGKMWRSHELLIWIGEDTTGESPSGMQYFYRDILILN